MKLPTRLLIALVLPLSFLLSACSIQGINSGSGANTSKLNAFTQTEVISNRLYILKANIRTYNSYLHVPENYFDDPKAEFPVVVFLHGWGEWFSSDPIPALFATGPLKELLGPNSTLNADGLNDLDTNIKKSFVIQPTLPYADGTYQDSLGWWNPDNLNLIIDYVLQNYRVNAKRLYMTGLSFGGGGTWYYAKMCPQRLAAMVPICNGPNGLTNLDRVKGLPVWEFYSFNDGGGPGIFGSDNVRDFSYLAGVQNIMAGYPNMNGNLLSAADGNYTISMVSNSLGTWKPGVVYPTGWFTYTLYQTGGHNAWDRTYANHDVWNWMFSQTK